MAEGLVKQLESGQLVLVNDMRGDNREIMTRLLQLEQKKYNDDNEIIFFSYPNDGTRATLSTGTTVLDYRQGTIKATDGSITRMSSSLSDQKKSFLRSLAINATAEIVIQLDENDAAPVKANTWTSMTFQQFQKLTITTSADTDVFCYACTNPKHAMQYAAESTVSVGKSAINHIDSDKDLHFTTAIAQNAIESEDITGLSDNRITITGVSLQADEAKNYRLWFFGSDAHTDANLDDDEFIDFLNFDLGTNGAQIAGAGQYYYSQTALNTAYEDEDASNELHVSLQNLDAGAKTAGAAGEVKIKVMYVPRS